MTVVVGGGSGAIYVAGVVDLLDEWRVFHEGQCVLQVVKGYTEKSAKNIS